jgi:uncharacterized protein (TIGR02444 family)
MEFPDHPFWDFSLEVYGTDGVAAACLVLQDAHQLDVNIVLYCCWIGASGRGALDAGETAEMAAAVAEWHGDVVRGVRAVRQRLKGGVAPAPLDLSESLRRRIAKIEVDLEHVEQLMLAATIDRPVDPDAGAERRAADAAVNVDRYFSSIGRTPSDNDRAAITTILAASLRAGVDSR